MAIQTQSPLDLIDGQTANTHDNISLQVINLIDNAPVEQSTENVNGTEPVAIAAIVTMVNAPASFEWNIAPEATTDADEIDNTDIAETIDSGEPSETPATDEGNLPVFVADPIIDPILSIDPIEWIAYPPIIIGPFIDHIISLDPIEWIGTEEQAVEPETDNNTPADENQPTPEEGTETYIDPGLEVIAVTDPIVCIDIIEPIVCIDLSWDPLPLTELPEPLIYSLCVLPPPCLFDFPICNIAPPITIAEAGGNIDLIGLASGDSNSSLIIA